VANGILQINAGHDQWPSIFNYEADKLGTPSTLVRLLGRFVMRLNRHFDLFDSLLPVLLIKFELISVVNLTPEVASHFQSIIN